MEQDLEDMLDWLAVLALPEEEFRRAIRPYFNDTGAMNMYIQQRAPQEVVRYAQSIKDEPTHYNTPTMPAPVLEDESPGHHYKGRRRKR